jgi:hypothetical protein
MSSTVRLQAHDFAKYLIAELVVRGKKSFRPYDRDDQRSVMSLLDFVAEKVEAVRARRDSPQVPGFKDLVRIRNNVAPSHTGAFDSFESLLRDQQHWLTSSRNPFYDVIEFDLPKSVAKKIIDDLDDDLRAFVREASNAYFPE